MNAPQSIRMAVQGAGLIGKRHIEHILASPGTELAAIIDPSHAGRGYAESLKAPWFPDFASALAVKKPDGLIIATPNQLHVEHGLTAVAARVPALIEKPIADDLEAASQLVQAGEAANVPLLVGHHRRHNPVIQRAKSIINSGELGRLVAAHCFFWLMKPVEYFEVPWRTQKGAGPVLVNMVHDIDLLRYLCGEIESVQAMESSAARGFEVEDSCVVLLRFVNGMLGTVTISDTVAAPWSWELTTGENPDFPQTNQNCYSIAGSLGTLTLPKLEIWSYSGKSSWTEPLVVRTETCARADPIALQIEQFCQVIRGEAQPLVSAREGLNTLRVISAIKQAALHHSLIRIEP